MSATMIAAFATVYLTAGPPNNSPVRDAHVVVFRYHPALLGPDREARSHDERPIWKAIKSLAIGYHSETDGSGVEVSVWRYDLPKWKAAIDKLIEDGVLRHYGWGTDNNGYGLVPVK